MVKDDPGALCFAVIYSRTIGVATCRRTLSWLRISKNTDWKSIE